MIEPPSASLRATPSIGAIAPEMLISRYVNNTNNVRRYGVGMINSDTAYKHDFIAPAPNAAMRTAQRNESVSSAFARRKYPAAAHRPPAMRTTRGNNNTASSPPPTVP